MAPFAFILSLMYGAQTIYQHSFAPPPSSFPFLVSFQQLVFVLNQRFSASYLATAENFLYP